MRIIILHAHTHRHTHREKDMWPMEKMLIFCFVFFFFIAIFIFDTRACRFPFGAICFFTFSFFFWFDDFFFIRFSFIWRISNGYGRQENDEEEKKNVIDIVLAHTAVPPLNLAFYRYSMSAKWRKFSVYFLSFVFLSLAAVVVADNSLPIYLF